MRNPPAAITGFTFLDADTMYYWPMTEASGNTAAELVVGGTNSLVDDLTMGGAGTTVVDGLIGKARHSTDAANYMRGTKSGAGTPGAHDRTIELWIRFNEYPASQSACVFSLDAPDTSTRIFLVSVRVDGTLTYQYDVSPPAPFPFPTNGVAAFSAESVPIGEWCSVHFVRRSTGASTSDIDMYLNGSFSQTILTGGPNCGTTGNVWCVGRYNNQNANGGNFDLQHVRISSKVRTASEIRDFYLAGRTPRDQPIDSPSEHMRVRVKDSLGYWRNLSSYPGFDAVKSANWRADIDNPLATASVTLIRELEALSLAPLMEASAPNKGFNPVGTYAPLIDVGREIKIETSVMPADMPAGPADWELQFHGYIDVVDAGSSEYVELSCRDLGAKLADTFIETERMYSLALVSGLPVSVRPFIASDAYVLNEYVIPSDAKLNGSFYKVTTAGTAASTEPTWPGAGTVASGTVVFTFQGSTTDTGNQLELILQNILTDNGTGVTLYAPVSAGWAVKGFIQQREPVLDAVRTLATQNGWDIRYMFQPTTGLFQLTLFEPDRAKAVADWSFTGSRYKTLDRSALDITRVRNVVRVIYSDPADKNADGSAKRKIVASSNASSITRYGRKFMEIAESDTSNIDTSAEATRLAAACLADLKDPLIDLSAQTVLGFTWADLGHLYAFEANSRHFSTAQSVAVAAYAHSAEDGRIRTTLTCRGKPAGRYASWLDLSNHPAALPGMALSTPQSGTAGPPGVLERVPERRGAQQNVAQSSPTALGLINSWTAHGGRSPSYWRDQSGMVHLQGAVQSGAISVTVPMAILPAGFRPNPDHAFVIRSDTATGTGCVTVAPSGEIFATVGSNVYIYLDGIAFRTDTT